MEHPAKKDLNEQRETVLRATGATQRVAFLDYCALAVQAADSGELTRGKAAYAICGIGGQVLDNLIQEDREIVHLAGILELPEGQRKGYKWEDLARMVLTASEK